MPSFDIVSEVDKHELQNAVEQTKRELENRFDFRGITLKVELDDNTINLAAPSDFQVQQIVDVLEGKMVKRGIDTQSLDFKPMDCNVQEARQEIVVKQGIDQEIGKKINKFIKEAKLKVQSQIQGDKLRVTGKKRDDLQEAIALVKEQEFGLGLQFSNFRD